MEKNRPDQEIDLLELLAKFFSALRKNVILTIACPLLGIALAVLIAKIKKESTHAEMMIVTDLLTEGEAKFLTEQLSSADTVPGINEQQRRNIGNLKYEVIKGEFPIITDKTTLIGKVPVYIQIKAETSDKKVLPVLQNVLVNYINGAEPVIKERRERKAFYINMIQKIDLELAAIEEVKKNIDSRTQATYLNPSELFSETVTLYDRKLNYQRGLKEIESIQIVKGFGSLSKGAGFPMTYYIVFGVFGGIIILSILMFIGYFANYYRNFEKNRIN